MRTVSLTPIITDRVLRIVLSWESSPKDLDLHSLFPVSRIRKCQVFFAKRECIGVNLDTDNIMGGTNGVETLTFTTLGNYIYAIAVNKYVDITDGLAPGEINVNDNISSNLSPVQNWSKIPLVQAKAKVSVYAPGFSDPILVVNSPTIIDSTTVVDGDASSPADNYDWWMVLCFDGSIGVDSILNVNKFMNKKPTFTDCGKLLIDYNNSKAAGN